MMKLSNAAKAFDKVMAVDAYGTYVFPCQFDLYDDSKRDGMTVERRIISAAHDRTPPARRAISTDGDVWVLGDPAKDYFKGKVIRVKYIGHRASTLATIKTVEQALLNSAGWDAYVALAWVKAQRQIEENSELTNALTLYTSLVEPVQQERLILASGKVYWTRQPYEAASGLLACVVDELESPWDTATLESRIYDPITDSYTGTVATSPALRMRWQEHFEYFSKSQESFVRGDGVVWTLTADVTLKAGDDITLSDGVWRVIRVTVEGAVQHAHIRRA